MMAVRLVSPTGKAQVLGAIHASAAQRAAYQKRLDAYIAAMSRRVEAAMRGIWRVNPPALAQDALTSTDVRDAIQRLQREWQGKFDELGRVFGRKAAIDATAYTDRAFRSQLSKAGFTVQFRMTQPVQEVVASAIQENVSLIKSIPEQYFTQVQSIVTEGVRVGRDMHVISEGLQKQLGVTRRRAETISRDQTNKATASVLKARYQEVGITQARWLHSAGGRHPRPSHVDMDGKTYDVAKGMWDRDADKFVWPGTEINCRCVSRAIIEGLN